MYSLLLNVSGVLNVVVLFICSWWTSWYSQGRSRPSGLQTGGPAVYDWVPKNGGQKDVLQDSWCLPGKHPLQQLLYAIIVKPGVTFNTFSHRQLRSMHLKQTSQLIISKVVKIKKKYIHSFPFLNLFCLLSLIVWCSNSAQSGRCHCIT